MIIDEKVVMPPLDSPTDPRPSTSPYQYLQSRSPASSSFNSTLTLSLPKNTLASLPAHILLQVIHHTFPSGKPQLPTRTEFTDADYAYVSGYSNETLAERQRRTLLWLCTSLRLVSRTLYTSCMYVLRSTYLPEYLDLVRQPYTSDPFPMGSVAAQPSAPGSGPPAYATSVHSRSASQSQDALSSPQRETAVLDRFILLKIRHDVLMDESSLHLDREDVYRDLFEREQPRARLEDLVREIGTRRGVVVVTPPRRDGATSGSRVRKLGMDPAENSSSASLQLLREVDTQMAARAAAAAARARAQAPAPQPQATSRKGFKFSFKKSSPPPSPSSASYSTASTSHFSSLSRRPPSPASQKEKEIARQHWGTPDDSAPLYEEEEAPPVHRPSSPLLPSVQPLPFHALSVTFQPRRLGLMLARRRTIAEVPRESGRRESLEYLATLLVDKLVREFGPG